MKDYEPKYVADIHETELPARFTLPKWTDVPMLGMRVATGESLRQKAVHRAFKSRRENYNEGP